MTNQQHPITPPPELLDKWDNLPLSTQEIFVIVAQWGADQELEACCEWVKSYIHAEFSDSLRAARRPKPPSLKEQALEQLQVLNQHGALDCNTDKIRRALEALPE
jgi:hypothetical protein